MKKVLLSTLGLVALSLSSPLVAADMAARPYAKASMIASSPIYNWTGFYIGGHIGGVFSGNNSNFGPTVPAATGSWAVFKSSPTISL